MRIRPGIISIIAAACLWGSFGLFVRVLQHYDFDPLAMTFWRAVGGLTVTLAFLVVRGRIGQLRVDWTSGTRLAGYGLISTALFPFSYFLAISHAPLAIAGILLYTSPVYVVLLAMPLFGEALTRRKVIALCLALAGAALVAGLGTAALGTDGLGTGSPGAVISPLGLGAGLLAGFTYALLSLGGKLLGRTIPPDTIMFYAYLTGAVVLGIAVPHAWQGIAAQPWQVWVTLLLMGAGPTFLAYRLFLRGMEQLEASVAGVVATLEPVIAALLGFLVLRERLGIIQVAGGLLVLASVVLLQAPAPRDRAVVPSP